MSADIPPGRRTTTLVEATIRAETRCLAMALAHYTSAVVMALDNDFRDRALAEALGEFETSVARIRDALAGRVNVRGGKPEG